MLRRVLWSTLYADLGEAASDGARRAAEAGRRAGGPKSPYLVVGAALVAGVALAKWIDWRGSGDGDD